MPVAISTIDQVAQLAEGNLASVTLPAISTRRAIGARNLIIREVEAYDIGSGHGHMVMDSPMCMCVNDAIAFLKA